MNKTIGTLQQLFTALCKIQRSSWVKRNPAWKPSERALKAWTMLSEYWQPIIEDDLKSLLSPSKAVRENFFKKRKVLYLPPLKKYPECVPALSLKYHLDKAKKSVGLRVMLIRFEEEEGKLYGFGFRLESPESESYEDKKEGSHDFYHAQLIRNFDKRPPALSPPINGPCWLPDEQLAFPLIADCPVTLSLCMLLSLYGQKYFWQFFAEHEVFNIDGYLADIRQRLSWKSQS